MRYVVGIEVPNMFYWYISKMKFRKNIVCMWVFEVGGGGILEKGGGLGLRSYTHETIRWDVVFKVEKLYLMLLSLLVYYLFFLQQNFVVDVSDL